MVDLGSEELTAMAALEARLSERAGFPLTIEKLLSWWSQFVEEVEAGYAASIDEYTNDLSTRDLIEEVLQSAPDRISDKLKPAIEPVDQRFRSATQSDTKGRLRQFIKPGTGWWWSRIPIKVSGSLRSDLQASSSD